MAPIPLLALRAPGLTSLLSYGPHRAATAWLLWGFASIAWSTVPVTTAGAVLATFGVWTTVVWFVALYGFTRFAVVYTTTMAAFLTAGFVRDLTILLEAGTVHRFAGYSLHPNNLAHVALFTVLLSIVQLVEHRRRTPVTWWSLGIGLAALAATGSRTPLIALVVCLLVMAYRRLGALRTALMGFGLVATVLFLVSVIPDPSGFIVRDENSQDLTSVNGRRTIWSIAWRATMESPILGNGVSSAQFLFPQASQRGELPFPRVEHAHNILLEISMSTGLVGLALFLLTVVGYFATRVPRPQLSGVAMIALVICGLTESVLSWRTSSFLVFGALLTERAVAGRASGNMSASQSPSPQTRPSLEATPAFR